MQITEVRVKLVDGGQDKLRAFCSITIDDAFVVRDLKVIEGSKGLFVAMPSRKLTTRCPRCGFKNQVRSNYCNDCGVSLPPDAPPRLDGKGKLHADIAHPINTECRELLQTRVVESYLEEVDASQQPGYRPRDIDLVDEEVEAPPPVEGSVPRSPERAPRSERTPVLADAVDFPPAPAPAPPPRRPTGRERGPLSELPPPDDNFSAGIF